MSDVPKASNEFECDVFELHERRGAGETPFVVDVREEKEFAIARIPSVTALPMSVFDAKWQEVLSEHKDREIIFM